MHKIPCSYELLNENSEDYFRKKFAHKLSINHIREARMTSRARSVRPRGPLPMTSLSYTVVAIFTDRYHHW